MNNVCVFLHILLGHVEPQRCNSGKMINDSMTILLWNLYSPCFSTGFPVFGQDPTYVCINGVNCSDMTITAKNSLIYGEVKAILYSPQKFI